jgi:group I intron endonuclease
MVCLNPNMGQCIIYLLTNSINGKVYVGQTWYALSERWRNGSGYRQCPHLQNAITKYGDQNFGYRILTVCGTNETADYWEDYFIEKYDSRNPDKGYNLRGGGSTGKVAETTKKKLSEALSGDKNPMFGKHHTIETRQKISEKCNNTGEHNPRAKLTLDMVDAIKNDDRPERTIAKDYGVSRSTINSIKRGINWVFKKVKGLKDD